MPTKTTHRCARVLICALLTPGCGLAEEISVSSLEALQAALTHAQPGDLVRIAQGAQIDLGANQLTVPGQVTLAGDGATITANPGGHPPQPLPHAREDRFHRQV